MDEVTAIEDGKSETIEDGKSKTIGDDDGNARAMSTLGNAINDSMTNV